MKCPLFTETEVAEVQAIMIENAFAPKLKPMTVIVAIIASDSILLASDSQTTTGNRKRVDAEKLSIIEIEGHSLLVAESGLANLSQRAVDFLKMPDQSRKIEKPSDLVSELEGSVSKVLKILEASGPRAASPEDFAEYVASRADFALTAAFYWDSRPYVFHVGSTSPVAAQLKGSFDSYASGGELGYFLLKEYCPKLLNFWNGLTTAVYVVEKVMENHTLCGGKTRVGVARKDGVKMVPSDHIEDIVANLKKYDHSTSTKQAEVVRDMLKKIVPEAEARDKFASAMGWENIPR
jgi:20S proteasome alpha/beta subunit